MCERHSSHIRSRSRRQHHEVARTLHMQQFVLQFVDLPLPGQPFVAEQSTNPELPAATGPEEWNTSRGCHTAPPGKLALGDDLESTRDSALADNRGKQERNLGALHISPASEGRFRSRHKMWRSRTRRKPPPPRSRSAFPVGEVSKTLVVACDSALGFRTFATSWTASRCGWAEARTAFVMKIR